MKFEEIKKIYNNSLPSTRSGVFYNTFPYPTKISPETVAIYIAMHTKPGDTVLDMFGGSGSTGLGALMCERPTKKMIELSEQLGINPTWGARNAEIYELGRYGSYASDILCNPPEYKEFSIAAKNFFNKAYDELGWLYECEDEDGNSAHIRHTIWSDVLICPECKHEETYHDLFIKHDPIYKKDVGECPKCLFEGKKSEFENKLETIYDHLIDEEIVHRIRVPVLLYGQTDKRKWQRRVNKADLDLINLIKKEVNFKDYKSKKIEWGELYRSGYHTGITHLHHFYTQRNFYVMMKLWDLTELYSEKIRDSLRLILLSYNSAHSTLMTRVVIKKNSTDFASTSSQSGVLYISSLPVEKNIIVGTERKVKNFIKAFKYVNTCSGKVNIINKSSTNLNQGNNSIDYIFTDPPFADFIPYSEANQINELWLDEVTSKKNEVIISKSQNKDLDKYQIMMTKVFLEANRVLKDKSNATVIFHSSKAKVWEAMQSVINSSGFNIINTSILNKTQSTLKQIVSSGSVKGDPVILLEKGKNENNSGCSKVVLKEIVNEAIVSKESDVKLLYSRYITKCLEKGVSIKLNSTEAYDYFSKHIGALEDE